MKEMQERKNIDSDIVQSWISNISFPTTAEELMFVIENENGVFDAEKIVKEYQGIRWTVPKWARRGDVIFFAHSVSAVAKIRAVRKQLSTREIQFSSKQNEMMQLALERALSFYKQWGGKIIGCARVDSAPVRMNTEQFRHWRSNTYSEITDTHAFQCPLPMKRFREFISISRTGAVTPLYGQQYDKLKGLLSEENELPKYVVDSSADILSSGTVTAKNWVETVGLSRRYLGSEDQFRSCYVDFLLKAISSVVYRECRCRKAGIPDSFADNVIRIAGRLIPVEVKFRVDFSMIKDQLWKYCYDDAIELDRKGTVADPEKVWRRYALLIDPEAIHVFDADRDTLNTVFKLDDLKQYEILEARDAIVEYLVRN